MIPRPLTDAIAHIELHRQEMAREGHAAAACNEALRRLHELLDREREASRSSGAGEGHAANIEAVTAEIERVKRLSAATGPGAAPKHGPVQGQKHVGPSQPHYRARNKGRRTMGRRGDR